MRGPITIISSYSNRGKAAIKVGGLTLPPSSLSSLSLGLIEGARTLGGGRILKTHIQMIFQTAENPGGRDVRALWKRSRGGSMPLNVGQEKEPSLTLSDPRARVL
jgi:hypothetical protein